MTAPADSCMLLTSVAPHHPRASLAASKHVLGPAAAQCGAFAATAQCFAGSKNCCRHQCQGPCSEEGCLFLLSIQVRCRRKCGGLCCCQLHCLHIRHAFLAGHQLCRGATLQILHNVLSCSYGACSAQAERGAQQAHAAPRDCEERHSARSCGAVWLITKSPSLGCQAVHSAYACLEEAVIPRELCGGGNGSLCCCQGCLLRLFWHMFRARHQHNIC